MKKDNGIDPFLPNVFQGKSSGWWRECQGGTKSENEAWENCHLLKRKELFSIRKGYLDIDIKRGRRKSKRNIRIYKYKDKR